ncbi:hypothetical protein BP00DRAFT_442670 [Aspergillus indologenus CBS 114.80]|uniref:Stress-response A/B barrel domain-containing protein n=1 Tax=Aspergillus indologenus CBS 114.80 TaxID=1450541 RepID=A0A2V5IFL8_9EURO|nr:hypothetical protein BP00DRAFT_442670 [Aspergillus indologenus CBS 114.80]
MAFLHLVLLRLKPEIPRGRRRAIPQEFMALPRRARIIREDNSHVFIVEFGSLQDREFDKNVIPIHAESASRIIPLVNLTTMAVFEASDFAD